LLYFLGWDLGKWWYLDIFNVRECVFVAPERSGLVMKGTVVGINGYFQVMEVDGDYCLRYIVIHRVPEQVIFNF
jgi:hypothetical protein